MKEFINNWNNSFTFFNLHNQLEEMRRTLYLMNFSPEKYHQSHKANLLTLEKLLIKLDIIQESYTDEEAKLMYEVLSEDYFTFTPKDEIIEDYFRILCEFNHYLQIYEAKQMFEICAKLRDCLLIQKRNYFKYSLKYTKEFTSSDMQLMEELEAKVRNHFLKQ